MLSPSANAQLDKQYQEQQRLGDIEKAKCVELHDLAQYSGRRGRYYIDQNQKVILVDTLKGFSDSDIISCSTSTEGTLNVENGQLIKIEGDFLVQYYEGSIPRKTIRRDILGRKRQ